ncbi:MAG TPA: hypothetical protein VHL57_12625 [Flavobacteriales bacterium]|jgi:hypothetical protein|nr:hypothetical protein [Flavobacteriales bacterium]
MADEKLIDKSYWLAQGYDLVNDAYARLSARIVKMNTYLLSLVTIYGGLGVFTVFQKNINDAATVAWLLAPFVLTSFGVVLTTLAQAPHKLLLIWTESWESCKYVVERYVRQASNYLVAAKLLALLGGVGLICVQAKVQVQKARNEEDTTQKRITQLTDSLKIARDALKPFVASEVQFEAKLDPASKGGVLSGKALKNTVLTACINRGDTCLADATTRTNEQGLFVAALTWKGVLADKPDSLDVSLTVHVSAKDKRVVTKRFPFR